MVVGFKEAETFKSVATASLSSERCSFSWARKKPAPLVITESTEPENGSEYSNYFIAQHLSSLTTVEQRQKVMNYVSWRYSLLSLKNTGSLVPDRCFDLLVSKGREFCMENYPYRHAEEIY